MLNEYSSDREDSIQVRESTVKEMNYNKMMDSVVITKRARGNWKKRKKKKRVVEREGRKKKKSTGDWTNGW